MTAKIAAIPKKGPALVSHVFFLHRPDSILRAYRACFFWSLLLLLPNLLGCSPAGDSSNPIADLAVPAPVRLVGQVQAIADIHKQPLLPQNPVYLRGKVQQQVPLLDGWVYQIQDDTGLIWIVTQAEQPTLGDEILVKGQVQQENISIGDEDIGERYIQEIEQIR
ncbi:MAG: hypothetical protein HC816_15995 [Leptolyngbyaceae cyanobacterium RM1_1_2]|nr:hypothetical protein [Leptolyngbyaceae cyanobacterium RM1_1_2]